MPVNMNPLEEALKARSKPKAQDSSATLLQFILEHFDLVPKGEEDQEAENGPQQVVTQESHVP